MGKNAISEERSLMIFFCERDIQYIEETALEKAKIRFLVLFLAVFEHHLLADLDLAVSQRTIICCVAL